MTAAMTTNANAYAANGTQGFVPVRPVNTGATGLRPMNRTARSTARISMTTEPYPKYLSAAPLDVSTPAASRETPITATNATVSTATAAISASGLYQA